MNNTFYTLLVFSWVILSGCGEQHTNQIPPANNTPTNNTPAIRTASTEIWQADLENGNYQNPILYADYSDPDVVRVGDDYFMTASSFNSAPGLPVLHSKDPFPYFLFCYEPLTARHFLFHQSHSIPNTPIINIKTKSITMRFIVI